MKAKISSDKEKIKVLLISGFLGAGKTTFLKSLLKIYENKKIGVLMNEFGEVGFDDLCRASAGRGPERTGDQALPQAHRGTGPLPATGGSCPSSLTDIEASGDDGGRVVQ